MPLNQVTGTDFAVTYCLACLHCSGIPVNNVDARAAKGGWAQYPAKGAITFDYFSDESDAGEHSRRLPMLPHPSRCLPVVHCWHSFACLLMPVQAGPIHSPSTLRWRGPGPAAIPMIAMAIATCWLATIAHACCTRPTFVANPAPCRVSPRWVPLPLLGVRPIASQSMPSFHAKLRKNSWCVVQASGRVAMAPCGI